jgi:carboxylesterase
VTEVTAVSVLSGAEPFEHDGGPIGVVLCHGFTGSPVSMRPWADFLANAGLSVRLPLLPGHGTRWQDLAPVRWPQWYASVEDAFVDLRQRCERVFVMGLSMGGTLALRLAEVHGPDVAGVVVVNPSLMSLRRSFRLLPVLERLVPSVRGITNDVALAGISESGYPRVPLRALRSLTQLWSLTRGELDRIDQPLLVFRSAVDHVVEAENTAVLLAGIRSADVEERVLPDSFHVATLDHDAGTIFTGSLAFVRRQASGVGPDSAPSLKAVQD